MRKRQIIGAGMALGIGAAFGLGPDAHAGTVRNCQYLGDQPLCVSLYTGDLRSGVGAAVHLDDTPFDPPGVGVSVACAFGADDSLWLFTQAGTQYGATQVAEGSGLC